MNVLKSLFAGFLLAAISVSAYAETDVCAPFKDSMVDASVMSRMLAAADQGHLYRIRPSTSQVGFCIDSPIGTIQGQFKEFIGGLTFLHDSATTDEQALVKVNTASLETNGVFVERMLKGKKFFDVENYPEILFVSTGFRWVSETEAVLLGKLTMHGVTKDVGFHVELVQKPDGSSESGEESILVRATTLIRRSEFGLTALSPMVSDSVNLCMSVEAVKHTS